MFICQVWDTRQRSCSHEFNVHEDYISDMTFQSSSMKLVATRFVFLHSSDLMKLAPCLFWFLCSGDGTLSVCNLRTNKVQSHSEFSEDELLSVVIMKVNSLCVDSLISNRKYFCHLKPLLTPQCCYLSNVYHFSASYLIDFRMDVKLSAELRMEHSCCIHGDFSRIAGKAIYLFNTNYVNDFKSLETFLY